MDKQVVIIDKTETIYQSAVRDLITFGAFIVSAYFASMAGGFFTAILGGMFLVFLFAKGAGHMEIVNEFVTVDDAIEHLYKQKGDTNGTAKTETS